VRLLSHLGSGMYRIHPALPANLAAWWWRDDAVEYDHQRAAAQAAQLRAYAGLGIWRDNQIPSGRAGHALAIIGLQRRTLGALFRCPRPRAVGGGAGSRSTAQRLLGSSGAEPRGPRVDRSRASRPRDADGSPPPFDSPAGALWPFSAGTQADRQVDAFHVGVADRMYRDILHTVQAQTGLATAIGMTRGELSRVGPGCPGTAAAGQGGGLVPKSLAIKEELGNRPGLTITYHQLGRVAENRGRLDEAEDWYRKSLITKEELGDKRGLASTYHHLGISSNSRAPGRGGGLVPQLLNH
jgi:Tetratricopeptide repeat